MICRPVKIWPVLGVNLRASNMITSDVKKEIKEVDITDTNPNNIYKTKKNFTGSCTQRSTRKIAIELDKQHNKHHVQLIKAATGTPVSLYRPIALI